MSEPAPDRERDLAALLARARSGEASAAAELDDALRPRLVRFCAAYLRAPDEAEDAAQEALARLFAARDGAAPAEPRAWVYRVARNLCLNRLRSVSRRREAEPMPSAFDAASEGTGPFTALAREDQRAAFARAFEALPEGEREALRLRYIEGLSREEIAQVLEVEPATVKTRLYAGLERLRGALANPSLRCQAP